jgi:CPA2 family monovalent cation:H+ antiporter-2
MLVSQVLMLLHVPVSRVVRTVGDIRSRRYSTLRSVIPREGDEVDAALDAPQEHQATVVLPPEAWAVGRSLAQVRERGAEVAFVALRRQGVTGREPAPDTVLRQGDTLVIFGLPAALEHAESLLLAG